MAKANQMARQYLAFCQANLVPKEGLSSGPLIL
jgi:hypothetical protein